MSRKLLLALVCCGLLLLGVAAAEEAHGNVAILYMNDVHCGIEDGVGYAGVAAYEKAYRKLGYDTLIVDNGDAIQGGVVGTISKGEAIIDIMNALGVDAAIPGNHEFDYGMTQFLALTERADYPYLSSNLLTIDGDYVLTPYTILEAGGYKIGLVGATTPYTFTSSTPTYFQDEAGNYIYSFCEGEDGTNLYAAVQKAVDAARADGADYVILMAHLGVNADDVPLPYTSASVITNTTGIDAVLDGHSHTVMNKEVVLNANGEEVLLSQTGTKLQNVGVLTLSADGTLDVGLHNETVFQDDEMAAFIGEINAANDALLNEVVATTQVTLTTVDPVAKTESGSPIRIVRSQETNLGDLCADAYRVMLDADIGFVNGGGIRANIEAGDITYADIISVHPFGNMACKVAVSGQVILDALEMGAANLPAENGGFIHVSGMSYEIDVSVPSPVVIDEYGSFVKVNDGPRRVGNVLVAGEPIDPEKTYTLASHNFWLKSGGDGMSMFLGSELILDEVMIDNQVLINYIVDKLGGVVGEDYADPYGQGRIVIKQ